MNGFYINKRFYNTASSYNELTSRQLIELSAILHASLPPYEAHIRILIELMNLRAVSFINRFVTRWRLYFLVSSEQLLDLMQLTEWVFKSEVPLTKNLLPKIRLGMRYLYGPADGLGNITFIEFIKAEAYYIRYVKTQDMEALHSLVAILYRPQRKDYKPKDPMYSGDRRERYNDVLVPDRAKRIATLPYKVKLAIFMIYDGCRSAIIQRHEIIFSRDPERAEAGRKKGWADVLSNLAGSVNAYEQTAFQPLDIVLFHLQGAILDNKELMDKLKK